MAHCLLALLALLVTEPAAGFNEAYVPRLTSFSGGSSSRSVGSLYGDASRMLRTAAPPQMRDGSSWLENAWRRYVLLRPDMSMDELRESTRLRTAKEWSWADRTPGTVRTIALSSMLLMLVAIPAILANPLVLPRLFEIAALSREGITPLEYFQATGKLW
jgi:hypothetical protein